MSWRLAGPHDDEAIVEMCLGLYAEDPSPETVDEAGVRRTLARLRAEPLRGRAVVYETSGTVAGYALLVSFWSNELGGEVCVVDELFVASAARGAGVGSSLFDAIAEGRGLWPGHPVALMLETTPANVRARKLYERAGFTGKNLSFRRRLETR